MTGGGGLGMVRESAAAVGRNYGGRDDEGLRHEMT